MPVAIFPILGPWKWGLIGERLLNYRVPRSTARACRAVLRLPHLMTFLYAFPTLSGLLHILTNLPTKLIRFLRRLIYVTSHWLKLLRSLAWQNPISRLTIRPRFLPLVHPRVPSS